MPTNTLYDMLRNCEGDQAILIEPEKEAKHTVFYFPGCGSERLFSDIGKASIYLLLKNHVRVILPPPFLCCGFPAKTNAKKDQFNRISLSDSILFSQIKRMFNDLDFDACVVSCGTCKESLEELNIESIFHCQMKDISEFVLSINPDLAITENCYYHMPCHDSLSGKGPEILSSKGKIDVQTIPFCCSEAGTLSLSRPDIAAAMLERKSKTIKSIVKKPSKDNTLYTNCPACIQGLSRNQKFGITPIHIAVALAEKYNKGNYQAELAGLVKTARIIQF